MDLEPSQGNGRLAVISDIHANIEAARAVLADAAAAGATRIVCLGDLIGYGPQPEEAVRLIRDLDIPCLLGNHEEGLLSPASMSWFNPVCRDNLRASGEMLSPASLEWLRGLPKALVLHGCRFTHGCPPDQLFKYLFEISDRQLRSLFSRFAERLCFVGHTHLLEMVSLRGLRADRVELGQGTIRLEPETRYIVNVGSVGQPRDGERSAKYAIWDEAADTVEIRFVPYDAEAVAGRIRELGFPEQFARRLL